MEFEIYPLGDAALTIRWAGGIDPKTFQVIQEAKRRLENRQHPMIREITSAYTTVTVFYDPLAADHAGAIHSEDADSASSYDKLCSWIREQLEGLCTCSDSTESMPVIEIPVCYGGRFGADLQEVAKRSGLSENEVVKLHSATEYVVYMVGFTPGFPYLGLLPEALEMPRRSEPRLAVPAGSVAIAGRQTGIYPLETPGGWHIIGRTPLKLFHPLRHPSSLLKAGDHVRFVPIPEERFEEICRSTAPKWGREG
jgi:inhibitor of KinA